MDSKKSMIRVWALLYEKNEFNKGTRIVARTSIWKNQECLLREAVNPKKLESDLFVESVFDLGLIFSIACNSIWRY